MMLDINLKNHYKVAFVECDECNASMFKNYVFRYCDVFLSISPSVNLTTIFSQGTPKTTKKSFNQISLNSKSFDHCHHPIDLHLNHHIMNNLLVYFIIDNFNILSTSALSFSSSLIKKNQ